MNICRDCGEDYIYDSDKPLGSSSVRCAKCRKKNSKLNIKFELLEISGDGNIGCRKCGYQKNASALILIDAVTPLSKPKTKEELKAHARKQFVLCLNCNAEIESEQVSVKINNANTYPVIVSFYESRVVIEQISTPFNYESEKVEVVTGDVRLNLRKEEKPITQNLIDV